MGRPDDWVFNDGDEPTPTKEKVVIEGNDARVLWNALARHLRPELKILNRVAVQYSIADGRFGCYKTVYKILGPGDAEVGFRPPAYECVIEPK